MYYSEFNHQNYQNSSSYKRYILLFSVVAISVEFLKKALRRILTEQAYDLSKCFKKLKNKKLDYNVFPTLVDKNPDLGKMQISF